MVIYEHLVKVAAVAILSNVGFTASILLHHAHSRHVVTNDQKIIYKIGHFDHMQFKTIPNSAFITMMQLGEKKTYFEEKKTLETYFPTN